MERNAGFPCRRASGRDCVRHERPQVAGSSGRTSLGGGERLIPTVPSYSPRVREAPGAHDRDGDARCAPHVAELQHGSASAQSRCAAGTWRQRPQRRAARVTCARGRSPRRRAARNLAIHCAYAPGLVAGLWAPVSSGRARPPVRDACAAATVDPSVPRASRRMGRSRRGPSRHSVRLLSAERTGPERGDHDHRGNVSRHRHRQVRDEGEGHLRGCGGPCW